MTTSEAAPVAIDLFSGAGGLSEGLLASGINVAVAVERHPDPALTHAFNHPHTTVVCSEMGDLSLDVVKNLVRDRTRQSRVDIVAGGPPCQGFSSAGRCDQQDPRNRLFEEFLRAVEELEPRMFLFENVPGLIRTDGGRILRTIIQGFRSLGYQIHDFDNKNDNDLASFPILNAAHYGVPQHRRRLLLVGWRHGVLEHPFLWPKATHLLPSANLDPTAAHACVSTEHAIDDLDFLSAGRECHRYLLPATSAYQRSRRSVSGTLLNHLATKHRKATVDMFRRIPQGRTIRALPAEFRSGKQRMRRLNRDTISWSVLALPDDYIHYRRHRIPTVREMARLQSFDDDFVFLGTRTTSDKRRRLAVPQYTQVGNAVPPLLAKALGTALCHALGGQAMDLRDLNSRKDRQRWLRGSSAYFGYTLDPEAAQNFAIYTPAGHPLPLPCSDEEEPVSDVGVATDWTQRRLKRWSQLVSPEEPGQFRLASPSAFRQL